MFYNMISCMDGVRIQLQIFQFQYNKEEDGSGLIYENVIETLIQK